MRCAGSLLTICEGLHSTCHVLIVAHSLYQKMGRGQLARFNSETLFAEVSNLNIDYAIKMSEDRELWRSSRPSLRCQPLSGGVAIE